MEQYSVFRKCLYILATTEVDLILLDYEMLVTSGPRVLEMLRSDQGTKYKTVN